MEESIKLDKFEYNYLSLQDLKDSQGRSFSNFFDKLKASGEAGWELCGFEYGCAFLKRKKGAE